MLRLKFYRDKAGLTQAELAKAAGVSLRTVLYAESNEGRDLRTSTLRAFAEVLGCSVDDLFSPDQKEAIA